MLTFVYLVFEIFVASNHITPATLHMNPRNIPSCQLSLEILAERTVDICNVLSSVRHQITLIHTDKNACKCKHYQTEHPYCFWPRRNDMSCRFGSDAICLFRHCLKPMMRLGRRYSWTSRGQYTVCDPSQNQWFRTEGHLLTCCDRMETISVFKSIASVLATHQVPRGRSQYLWSVAVGNEPRTSELSILL